MSTRRGFDTEPDLLVIGGGAGGLAAARAGVRRGARTLLVQHGRLGGDCTSTGCVPSKALIEAAGRGVSFAEAMAGAHTAVETVAAAEDDEVLSREGVEVLHGWVTLRAGRQVEVEGTILRPRRIILATGARPAVPPIPGLEEVDYLTNESLFELATAPVSLAVLGGGAIGGELAQALQRLGVKVTVVEGLDRILPREEPEASKVIAGVLAREGVDVRTGAKVARVEALERKGAARLHLEGGAVVEAERLLVAVGRRADTDSLGLEAAGISSERGFIVTGDHLATSAAGIWAVGDVAGKLQFTHAADEMGRIAAGNALSRRPPRRFHPEWIPWVTFTDPEVARVGILAGFPPCAPVGPAPRPPRRRRFRLRRRRGRSHRSGCGQDRALRTGVAEPTGEGAVSPGGSR